MGAEPIGPGEWGLLLDEVAASLENLSRILDAENRFRPLLEQFCAQVSRTVPRVDDASVTLLHHDSPHTAASTSDTITELEEVQYRTGHGPCLEAATTGKLIKVQISDAAQRWPEFAAACDAEGYDSFLVAPLVIDEQYTGAVNCYGRQGHGFVDLDAQVLNLYTAVAETALRALARYDGAREHAEQLRSALESRAVIDQAKGMIMGANRVSADEAFEMLVERSQQQNRKLRDIATELVESVLSADA